MVSSINSFLSGLSSVYNQNNLNLSQTLLKLASGKKFLTPSDDITGYFRSQNLEQQYEKYQRIQPNMQEWKGVMDIASTAGGEVYSSLERMKELSDLYPTADAATQTASTAEYNKILSDLNKTISTTYYGSYSLLNQVSGTPIKKIDLVPDPTGDTQRMLIDPGEAVTSAHLTALIPATNIGTAGANAAITTAMGDAQAFLGNVSAYSTGLQSHLNITDSIMQNTQSAKSAITDIDTAQEMITFTQQNILSQASLAMIAQANMSQRSILFLYGMNGGSG
jgi:flagellin